MEKQNSSDTPGIAPPPSYDSQNVYPSNVYPAGNAYAPNDSQNVYPSNSYPAGNAYAPNTYPPIVNAPTNYPAQPANTIVITGGPAVLNFGPNRHTLTCPYCHHSITTRVENKPTMKTHLIALVLCICLCWLCCCCPYCMDSCQGRDHYCPQCSAFLGSYNN